MAFEWDPDERAAFDAQLVESLQTRFPDARFTWTEEHRRLLVVFPDGAVTSVYEPNFFFSYPSFSLDVLFGQAGDAIAGQRRQLASKIEPETF